MAEMRPRQPVASLPGYGGPRQEERAVETDGATGAVPQASFCRPVYVRLDARLGRALDNVERTDRLVENRPEKYRYGSDRAAIDCFNQRPSFTPGPTNKAARLIRTSETLD
jgi:hypothetical protein